MKRVQLAADDCLVVEGLAALAVGTGVTRSIAMRWRPFVAGSRRTRLCFIFLPHEEDAA